MSVSRVEKRFVKLQKVQKEFVDLETGLLNAQSMAVRGGEQEQTFDQGASPLAFLQDRADEFPAVFRRPGNGGGACPDDGQRRAQFVGCSGDEFLLPGKTFLRRQYILPNTRLRLLLH